MSYASLGDFIAELQDHGELIRIGAPVDAALEIAAITDRLVKSSSTGGPALLFENVKNSTIPVVTNLLGNQRRLSRALGVTNVENISTQLMERLQSDQASGWLGSLFSGGGSAGLGRWSPKVIKTGACQQVVKLGRDVNLWDLPIPRCWPDEPFPVITAAQILMRGETVGATACFQSPLVVTGRQELALYDGDHCQVDILQAVARTQQNLPVAISLGGDPALRIAVTLPGVDDACSVAGLLRGASMEFVRCRTNELEIPTGAEIVIEGYFDATNLKSSNPLPVARGNGRYVRRELPLIQVTALTHRANPVFPASVIAVPPSEESWIATATDRMLLPMLRRVVPEIVDIHQPLASANRNLLFVSISNSADYEARRVLHALWGMKSIGQTKLIVIVDADQDVHREEQVWFSIGTNACPQRDFIFADGLARDDDYTPLTRSHASRVGIDATRKVSGERSTEWPQSLKMSDAILAQVRDRWTEYRVDTK